jgi:hypothetical protein
MRAVVVLGVSDEIEGKGGFRGIWGAGGFDNVIEMMRGRGWVFGVRDYLIGIYTFQQRRLRDCNKNKQKVLSSLLFTLRLLLNLSLH